MRKIDEAEPPVRKDVKVGPETTAWLELRSSASEWTPTSVPTASVRRIEVRNRLRGAAEGLLIGGTIGVAAGVIFAAIESGQSGKACSTCGEVATGVLLFGLPGGMLGTFLGGSIGHRIAIDVGAAPSSAAMPSGAGVAPFRTPR